MRTKHPKPATETFGPNDSGSPNPDEKPTRPFSDKPGLANRYAVSERTIDNWMRQGRVPFLKCGRVVRFNIARCDAALGRFEKKEVR